MPNSKFAQKPALIFAAVGTCAVLLFAFYWTFLTGQKSFFYKDVTHFFEPLLRFIGTSMAKAHLPLWNPYSYCGMSQAAISSPSLFYPFNWLFAFLPFNQAMALVMISSHLVAFVGMLLLIESLGWGILPAAVAGVVVALSGYMFSLSSNYTLVASAAWLPLLFHSVRQCALNAKRPFLYFMLTAICVFMVITAGRPEVGAPGLGAAFILAVVTAGMAKKHGQPFAAAHLFKAVCIGMLLSMPVVLPSLEWLPLSRRSQGLDPAEILMYSSNWYDILSVAVSQPLGDLQLRRSAFAPLVLPKGLVPYYGSAFVGTLSLVLAILGLQKKGGWVYWSCLVLLVGSVVASLGANIPGASLIVPYIPGASLLRFPCKLLFFAVFAIALFAARGSYLYLNEKQPFKANLIFWSVASAICFVVLFQRSVVLPFYAAPVEPGNALAAQMGIITQTLGWCLTALSASALLWFMQLVGKQRYALGYLFAAMAVTMMFHANRNCAAAAAGNYFAEESMTVKALEKLSMVQGQRVTGLYPERLSIPLSLESADKLQGTINVFQYSRQLLRPFTNMDYGVPSAFGFEGSMNGQFYYLFLNLYLRSSQATPAFASAVSGNEQLVRNDVPIWRLLRICSSDFAITQSYRWFDQRFFKIDPKDIVQDDSKSLGPQPSANLVRVNIPALDANLFSLELDDKLNNVRIYKVKDVLPRAYLSYSWSFMDAPDKVIEAIADEKRDGLDPAAKTLLEKEANVPLRLDATANLPLIPVKFDEPYPEQISGKVNAEADGILVLSDQYYPGWVATVDGQETQIFRCNGFMRGIYVPAGKHTFAFNYRPSSVTSGFWLLLLGVFWCVVVFIQQRRSGTAGGVDESQPD